MSVTQLAQTSCRSAGRRSDMTPAPPSSRRTVTAPHTGLLSTCSAKEDFLSLLRRRKDRWMETDYVARTGLWQAAVDDKLLGFVYARSRNIRTPDVLFCHSKGYSALPRQWPKTWGCCFVIKPLRGYNDFGILLVEGGVHGHCVQEWLCGVAPKFSPLDCKGADGLAPGSCACCST